MCTVIHVHNNVTYIKRLKFIRRNIFRKINNVCDFVFHLDILSVHFKVTIDYCENHNLFCVNMDSHSWEVTTTSIVKLKGYFVLLIFNIYYKVISYEISSKTVINHNI